MNLKQDKGITLLVLSITIIVMLIIAGISLYEGKNIVKNAQLENIKTNMLLIQAKGKIIAEEANFNKTTTENGEEQKQYLGTNLNIAISADSVLSSSITNVLQSEEMEKYYVLGQDDLNTMGLNKIEISDGVYYIINYETEEIIYIPGYKYEGNTYYKLSDINSL